MKLFFSEQFQDAYHRLTSEDKRKVRKTTAQLAENPKYPGLQVKKMKGWESVWEARASRDLRLTFDMTGDTLNLRNVGHHDDVLKRP